MNEALALSVVRLASSRNGNGRPSSLHLVGSASVHHSANVVGPVVLQDGAAIEENVTLIGPTVVGRGSRVERGATVAQSVVGHGQVVPAGATLRHRVFLGASEGDGPGPGADGTEGWDSTDSWETQPRVLAQETPHRSFYPTLKRALDAAFAAIGLIAFAPFGLLIAALIKLESKGPIHFGHVREGMGGRPFRCWKYRTMIPGADQQQRKLARMNQMDGPQFKVKKDPRRTRMGRILSATNLDEIPQLWNVLLGEMSLVGPRPSPFRENQVCVPWREGRLSVRPGVTGLWQICRHDRDKGDFHQWIYFDLLYVRNMSFWLDLKILVLTPLSFLRSGYIPLRWLLPPDTYGERRTARRETDLPLRQERRADAPAASPGLEREKL
jgi:lipopolysaccharide/colanic/teichoic acid biosynthesis glycosyltransferase